MLEAAIVTRLAAIAPNLYPLRAPLDYATPAVIYNRISTDPIHDMDGEDGMAFILVQVDVYDSKFIVAKTLAKTIRDDLVQWRDDAVASVSWTGETDSIDETTDVALYRTMITFMIFADVS